MYVCMYVCVHDLTFSEKVLPITITIIGIELRHVPDSGV